MPASADCVPNANDKLRNAVASRTEPSLLERKVIKNARTTYRLPACIVNRGLERVVVGGHTSEQHSRSTHNQRWD
ncbi:hypothetical protein Tcan_09970 [Toxocara canis]|uniref:Uncharacterized protein n=1 Tax=Toxocara canis TaxID=6265 RepID=A0A0B2V8U1_TOXCA|nr:hypothetical protein Tcan_09970 [Toxocara canis]